MTTTSEGRLTLKLARTKPIHGWPQVFADVGVKSRNSANLGARTKPIKADEGVASACARVRGPSDFVAGLGVDACSGHWTWSVARHRIKRANEANGRINVNFYRTAVCDSFLGF